MRWREEIVELHEFFRAYYLGEEDSLARAETALHPQFSIVDPRGAVADRAATLERLASAHEGLTTFDIATVDHRLLHAADDLIVAEFVEVQQRPDGSNERLSTVVFLADRAGPNGLVWLRVHQTWIAGSEAG